MNDLIRNMYDKKYYVYEHYIDGNLIYIGKGRGARALEFNYRPSRWKNVVRERYDEIEVKIIGTFDDEKKALEYEAKNIFKNRDSAHLTNGITYKKLSLLNFNETKNKSIKIPEEYLDKPLTKKDKDMMCEELNILNVNFQISKWRAIKSLINDEESKYNVRDSTKTINGKRARVSIITYKEDFD